MIRIKAIAAIALAGLGGATMGTDVYLSSRASSPPRAIPPAFVLTDPSLVAISAAAMPVLEPNAVVRLDPVTIYGRDSSARRVRHAKPLAEPQKRLEIEICSDWQSLASGPVSRGVRQLCTPGSSGAGP